MRVKRVRIQGRMIRLLSIQDLIKMKSRSHRPQDIEDVGALRKLR
jgi:predicted nucleotidyltransferase